MRKIWLWWSGAVLVTAVIAYAWIDGGREPQREIFVPVTLPVQAQ